jgi:hypothetical protein
MEIKRQLARVKPVQKINWEVQKPAQTGMRRVQVSTGEGNADSEAQTTSRKPVSGIANDMTC